MSALGSRKTVKRQQLDFISSSDMIEIMVVTTTKQVLKQKGWLDPWAVGRFTHGRGWSRSNMTPPSDSQLRK